MNTLYAHDGYLNTFMRMRTEAAQREQGRRNWGKGARVPLVACVPSFPIFVYLEKRVGIENILLDQERGQMYCCTYVWFTYLLSYFSCNGQ